VSGYAGIFHFDGAPVERAWLEKMVDFLGFRGPDGSQVWCSGNAGLCHTLLRTSKDTDGKPQILSLDGGVTWIAGDIRIDDRQTLIAKLPGAAADLKKACSAELVLHSYAQWGESCVEHLLGDFSFVIWDARRRQAFCARDHLGIKPFYYARLGECLIVSNTLDCIRQAPIVSSELNEQAIGDFLLVGENKEPTTTFFSAISTLPPARRLIARLEGIRMARYWTMPIDEPLYYKRKSDYVDQFHGLLRQAVGDRLPDGKLGILMSGGLDSPALAVAAVQLGADVTAFTCVYDRLIPDEERHYAGLVARHLGIPIRYTARDDEPYGWEPGAALIHTPEPCADPLGLAASRQYNGSLASQARVFLFGYGVDDALRYEWEPYVNYLISRQKWGRLSQDVISDFSAQPRIPFLSRLPRMWKDRKYRQDATFYESSLPAWIDKEFEARLGLPERLRQIECAPPSPHTIRPEACAVLTRDFPVMTGWDAADTQTQTESRQPFWDLRVQRFLLAVPPVPWSRNKHLIRTALSGLLPEAVRLRPKSPLAGLPYLERARHLAEPVLAAIPSLGHYVDMSKLPKWPGRNRKELDDFLRVLALRYWVLGL
jgi:asparagine synthase (glutamine-hydrolysing)